MSIFQKIFFDPKHRKRGLILAFTIFGISVSVITGTFVYQLTNPIQTFPKFKTHADIPVQPITTFADSTNVDFPNDKNMVSNSSCAIQGTNWIADENNKVGIDMHESDWQQLDLKSAKGSALWLNKTSVSCGDQVEIHASLYGQTSDPKNNKRTFHALRVGWYNGAGARQLWESKEIALKSQKILRPKSNLRMVDTKWPVSVKFEVGNDWTPGLYLIASENKDGAIENVAPLIVRAPFGTSHILLMHSFLTWNLYNSFGNRSAYFGAGEDVVSRRDDRSRVVSFDRPIVGSGGYSIHRDGISMVQFLEKNGFNYDQVSDLDIDSKPSLLNSYNELVLAGHVEYMTRRIFESIISARNHGINLAIFGGNTALWQTRLTESPVGPNRRIIMYRKATEDPVSDPRQITIEFADKRLNIPQTLFTGTLPSGTHVFGNYKAFKIPKWLKLASNSAVTGISPDSEIEAIAPKSAASPPNINVMFSGQMTYADPSTKPAGMNLHPEADVIWFTNPNGQATFNAGLTTWACDLIDTCAYSTVDEKSRTVLDQITKSVLTLWQDRGVGKSLKS